MAHTNTPKKPSPWDPRYIAQTFLFQSRWILAVMYLGLAVVLGVYAVRFGIELQHLVKNCLDTEESEFLVQALQLVDISMVGALIVMIMQGSWQVFIHRIYIADVSERPQWLDHINSGLLKVKMGMSLVGVTGIHLLKSFMKAEHGPHALRDQLTIHVIFVVSMVAVAWVDKMMSHSREAHKENHENNTNPSPSPESSAH